MQILRCVAALALASGAAAITQPAQADPAKGFPAELHCDNGQVYSVVVAGNGDYTPAHIQNSTSMVIPTMFGEFHGTVTDAQGNVLEEVTDPATYKGGSNKPRATNVVCTYEFHETFEDPELGLLTFHGTGSVGGFMTPAR